MPNNQLFNLFHQINDDINSGNLDKALVLVNKLRKINLTVNQKASLSGLLIDLGTLRQDIELIQEGVEYLENNLDNLRKSSKNVASIFYNLGNGYMSLFSLKSTGETFFVKSELYKAKIYYRKAKKQPNIDKNLESQVLTSLGNCYDSLGRTYEALECYEKAFNIDPLNGMAVGNKGIALYFYSGLMGEKQGTYLVEAYKCLQDALRNEITPESVHMFEVYVKSIENIVQDIEQLSGTLEFPGYTLTFESEIEKSYLEFCKDNQIFLNICNFCNKCDASIGDTAIIQSMIVETNIPLTENPYFILSEYLNQIKQDYVISRFILFLSRYKQLKFEFVDKNVVLIETLSYKLHNIYAELLKTSFKGFYNILDKIASFINYYLGLGMKETKIYFHNVWYADRRRNHIRKKIEDTSNKSLNALFDIHHDFSSESYKKFTEIRNSITHRFLSIKLFKTSKNDSLTEEELFNYSLKLAKIIRNVILYLLHFVYLEESKKKDDSGRKIIKMKAEKIPDHLKY